MPIKCSKCKKELKEGDGYVECPKDKSVFDMKCAKEHVKRCTSFHRKKTAQ